MSVSRTDINCLVYINDRIRSADDRGRSINNQDAFENDRLRLRNDYLQDGQNRFSPANNYFRRGDNYFVRRVRNSLIRGDVRFDETTVSVTEIIICASEI